MRAFVRVVATGLCAAVVAFSAMAGAQEVGSADALAGVWKGQVGDKPGVELHLRSAGGVLTGKAVFLALSADGSHSSAEEVRKVETPLLGTKVDGGVLRFGVKRGEDGGLTNMEFRLRPSGEGELRVIGASTERKSKQDTVVVLKRSR